MLEAISQALIKSWRRFEFDWKVGDWVWSTASRSGILSQNQFELSCTINLILVC